MSVKLAALDETTWILKSAAHVLHMSLCVGFISSRQKAHTSLLTAETASGGFEMVLLEQASAFGQRLGDFFLGLGAFCISRDRPKEWRTASLSRFPAASGHLHGLQHRLSGADRVCSCNCPAELDDLAQAVCFPQTWRCKLDPTSSWHVTRCNSSLSMRLRRSCFLSNPIPL